MLGSCFTQSIGEYLQRYLFDVNINPFGTIYNPLSVARNLSVLLDKKAYGQEDLYLYNERWLSFDHYTAFSNIDKEKLLLQINTAFIPAAEKFRQSDRLLLTFGTSWVYRLKENNRIVCNCHKVPADYFERFRLSVNDIVNEYTVLIKRLISNKPDLRIIFTVSPVRHWKDGAHGNQLSKAVLLLAIEEIINLFPANCYYFPAYELVLDDLRDYRFYDSDLLHPSSDAVNYIREKFSAVALSDESIEFIKKLDPLLKSISHRPSDPEDPEYLKMMENVRMKITALKTLNKAAVWERLG